MEKQIEMIEIAKIAAKSVGKIILKYFQSKVDFEQKSDKTFVSKVDRESEEEIKKIIFKNFPNHSINGEEFGKMGGGGIIWHVDPLDGTNNFKNKIPYSCVSIGIERGGEFIIGVIYNPFSDELFYAETGKGAYLNEKRLHVNTLDISEGIVVLDASFKDDRTARKIKTQNQLIKSSFASSLRMIGSNALQFTEIARGNCVSSISDAIHTYDFAAGIVLVKEAWGLVTDQYGDKPNSESKVIIASNNAQNHDKIINITSKTYNEYKGM